MTPFLLVFVHAAALTGQASDEERHRKRAEALLEKELEHNKQKVNEYKYATQHKMTEEARRAHAKADEMKEGLQKERERLAAFAQKEKSGKKAFNKNVGSFDADLKAKMTKSEEHFQAAEKASLEKFDATEKKGLQDFKDHEASILDEMKTALSPEEPASFLQTSYREHLNLDAPEIPPKLAEAQHKMEIGAEHDFAEIKKDTDDLEDMEKRMDVDSARQEHREESMKDKFEKRLSDSESAFESALVKEEKKNRQEGEALINNFDNAMEAPFRHSRHGTSYIETAAKVEAGSNAKSEDKASTDAVQQAEAKLEAKLLQEVQAAAKTKLGAKMRDMLQGMSDERYTQRKQITSERAETHRQLEEVKLGLKREESRLKEYSAKEDAKRKALMGKLQDNDAAFEKKLDSDEAKFVEKTKDTASKYHKKYDESRAKFKEHEKKALQTLQDAFEPADSSFVETSNLRSGA